MLDSLFAKDGQPLSELCENLDMTRFGVMKHLKILEEAHLLTTKKVGREKLHYLNPIPIQMVYDRWVSKYAKPFAAAMTNLKYTLESKKMAEKHKHVFEVYIATTPEKLWQAITDGEMTKQYYFGSAVEGDWRVGGKMDYPNPAGGNFIDCTILEIEKPTRLMTTFIPLWAPELPEMAESRVTFDIEQKGEICKLTLTHDELDAAHPLVEGIREGWSQILSGLKTLLETGRPLALGQGA